MDGAGEEDGILEDNADTISPRLGREGSDVCDSEGLASALPLFRTGSTHLYRRTIFAPRSDHKTGSKAVLSRSSHYRSIPYRPSIYSPISPVHLHQSNTRPPLDGKGYTLEHLHLFPTRIGEANVLEADRTVAFWRESGADSEGNDGGTIEQPEDSGSGTHT